LHRLLLLRGWRCGINTVLIISMLALPAAAFRLKVRPGMSEAELEGLLRDELVLKPGAAGTGSLHALHLS
jgi:hypothetical protein